MQTHNLRQGNGGRRAFTLVELIVTIGLIALLIALLIPAVSKVQRASQLTQCASNLRQIAGMALGWAADHQGYVPLDGEIEVSAEFAVADGMAPGVSDPNHQRYAYTPITPSALTPVKELPTPFLIALSQRSKSSAVLLCPSAHRASFWDMYSSVTFFAGIGTPFPAPVATDYATNGGLLGFHYSDQANHRRYRGKLSAVRRSSHMVLCGDSGSDRGLNWTPILGSVTPTVTLLDVLKGTAEVQNFVTSSRIDPKRHPQNKTNIAFVDGHVDSVAVTEQTLRTCELLQGR